MMKKSGYTFVDQDIVPVPEFEKVVRKWEDLGLDNHSSKNISLPLVVERRLQILNKDNLRVEVDWSGKEKASVARNELFI